MPDPNPSAHAARRGRLRLAGGAAPPAPILSAVQRDVAERRADRGMRRGAASLYAEFFVRYGRREVVVASPWGERFGAWRLEPFAEPSNWQPVDVWIDVAGRNLGANVKGSESRWPNRARDWRQHQLELLPDDNARCWNERNVALTRVLRRVPPAGLRQVARVRPHQQWALLALLNAAGPPAVELCQSNPALAYLVATRPSMEPVDALLARRQGDIVAALGLPGHKLGARVMRRVEPRVIEERLLRHLVGWLTDPEGRKRLAHSPRIGRGLLYFRTPKDATWLRPRALAEALAEPDGPRARRVGGAARVVASLARLGAQPERPLRGLGELEAWIAEQRRLLDDLGDAPMQQRLRAQPFRGEAGCIEPIRTVGELREEGRIMRHCAFSYLDDALAGRVAFYRVLAPERATLALHRPGPGRPWDIESMKCRANAEPSNATHARVRAWLAACRAPRQRRRRVDGRQEVLDL